MSTMPRPDIDVLIALDSRAPSVSVQPHFDIACWQVIEDASSGSRFLIGYSQDSGRARLSSPIEGYASSSATVMTLSGRIYTLCGAGRPNTCDPLWQVYLRSRGFDLDLLTDVSREFRRARH